jgi:hypothetical protein
MPPSVRARTRDGVTFTINYASETRPTPSPRGARFLLGGPIYHPRE